MDRRAESDEDHGANWFEKIEFVAHVEAPLSVKECDGDDDKLDGHQVSKDLENNLEHWPFFSLHQTPAPWRQDEGIPCSDCESANEEVLVSREMRGKVEICWKQRRDIVSGAHSCQRLRGREVKSTLALYP